MDERSRATADRLAARMGAEFVPYRRAAMTDCPQCKGIGIVDEDDVMQPLFCGECDGAGKVEESGRG